MAKTAEELRIKRLRELSPKSHHAMIILSVLIIAHACVPLLLWSFGFGGAHKEALLSFSLIASPLITFFGFIWLGEYLQTLEKTLGVLRTAITAASVTAYLVLLALTIFIAGQQTQFPLQEQLVNSFTTIMGVLIAFYFGASAYTQKKSGT